ncbi:metallophosphoesterase family protein [Acidicapsa dinghuensis]|uniref:Metallophosphoesterase family protein n=1 Tax=Acidicapsa dinghuensis TaxID=2218256 RepID=A0ABW1ED77_9BACT|nr:metallophosphoesterase [Acidicapsa dinghuensis]
MEELLSSAEAEMSRDGDVSNDGIDRRGFLKCMAWAGTGLVWSFAGGVPTSRLFAQGRGHEKAADFTFVQISDSHLGFNKPANTDVAGTLQVALDRIDGLKGAMKMAPDFLIHTGDLTHGSKPAEFDQVAQMLGKRQVFYVPGEHDTSIDDGKAYLERYGKGTKGSGWYSFDHKGVHFIGLNNVLQLEGMGKLGEEQLAWLRQDLAAVKSSQPVAVFAHIPLWAVYPEWGWGTADGEQALAMLKKFGSVTVLNGHIHQVMQKVEGNVTFHTAMSTAFPQPAPGSAPSPGPMKVPEEKLQSMLGITNVSFAAQRGELAVVDAPLGA